MRRPPPGTLVLLPIRLAATFVRIPVALRCTSSVCTVTAAAAAAIARIATGMLIVKFFVGSDAAQQRCPVGMQSGRTHGQRIEASVELCAVAAAAAAATISVGATLGAVQLGVGVIVVLVAISCGVWLDAVSYTK